jgi:recombination protein RecA
VDVLSDLEAKLQKQFKGIVIRRGSDPIFKIKRVPTGLIGLDVITGGGLPVGRLTQFQGPDASGKSTAALYIIKHNQEIREEFNTVWVASESFDEPWATKIGVDLDKISIMYPDTGEEGLSAALSAIEDNTVDFLVIDSTAALLPIAEAEGGMEDKQMGEQARMFAKFCRKLGATFNKASGGASGSPKMAVVAINQVRDQIGVFSGKGGKPEPQGGGGRALKHTKSLDIYFRLGEVLKNKDVIYGRTLKTKVTKSKVSAPYGTAEFKLYIRNLPEFGALEGSIDTASDARIYGVEYGVIELGGHFYTIDGKKFNGKDSVTEYLRTNREVRDKVTRQIREILYGVEEENV